MRVLCAAIVWQSDSDRMTTHLNNYRALFPEMEHGFSNLNISIILSMDFVPYAYDATIRRHTSTRQFGSILVRVSLC